MLSRRALPSFAPLPFTLLLPTSLRPEFKPHKTHLIGRPSFMSTAPAVRASRNNRLRTTGRSTRVKLPWSSSWCHHMLLPQCVFPDCLAQSWPVPAITQAPPLYSLARSVLAGIPPSPWALPCPHWPMLVSAQCLLAISSQTPQLA